MSNILRFLSENWLDISVLVIFTGYVIWDLTVGFTKAKPTNKRVDRLEPVNERLQELPVCVAKTEQASKRVDSLEQANENLKDGQGSVKQWQGDAAADPDNFEEFMKGIHNSLNEILRRLPPKPAGISESLLRSADFGKKSDMARVGQEPAMKMVLTDDEWAEQSKVRSEILKAHKANDQLRLAELDCDFIRPYYSLKLTKLQFGADYIRKKGYDTRDADIAYGVDWLDEAEATISFEQKLQEGQNHSMTTRANILERAKLLIDIEALSTVEFRRTRSGVASSQVREAVAGLYCLLTEAAERKDLELMLEIERTYLESELRFKVQNEESLKEYSKIIPQIRAALIMLKYVKEPSVYRWVSHVHSLAGNLNQDLPMDAAQKFFALNETRLYNLQVCQYVIDFPENVNIRRSNNRLMKKLYMKLQREALAVPLVRAHSKQNPLNSINPVAYLQTS